MIVADTAVWIDHFRRRNARLAVLLTNDAIIMHDCVLGELACGNLADRVETLNLLRTLERATSVDTDEVLVLIERHRLMGTGLGWADVQLLASALVDDLRLWTLDKRLARAAESLGVAHAA